MEKLNQFVIVPKKENGILLKKYEILIYACIRRYMNKDTRTAFPSIATISEHCQCSENLVRQAIERLSECGYLQVTARKNQTNLYTFPELLEKFEMFTPEFLDDPNVDTNLKAYIIGLQALSFINSENKTQSVCGYSNYEIADKLNISERKVKTYNAELKGKEILTEVSSTAIDEAGFNKSLKIIDLDKIHLAVLYVAGKVVEMEERQDEFDERLQKIEEALLRISRQSQVAYESSTKKTTYKKKYKKAGN